MPWKSFEGEYRLRPEFEGQEWPKVNKLEIDVRDTLKAGDQLVLYGQRNGILRRRLNSRLSAEVIDDDRVRLTLFRPHEPVVGIGWVSPNNYFTSALQYYQFTKHSGLGVDGELVSEDIVIAKQDIAVHFGKGLKQRGLLWYNQAGEREAPVYMVSGRNFYPSDTDPEALKVFAELDEKRRLEESGLLVRQPLAAFGGISIGLTYQISPQED